MKENMINRKTYKRVKKMDRQEMESFLVSIYKNGFKDGAEAGENADFRIWISGILKEVPGVGATIYNRIMAKVKEMEGNE